MKKIVLIAVMALSLCVARADGENRGCIVKGGVNFSNMVMGVMPHGMKVGGHLGAEWEYAFSRRVGMSGGLLMSFQGAKFDISKLDPIGHYFKQEAGHAILKDIDYSAIYFNIPVMGKLYITPNFSFDLGPQLAVNVQNRFTSDGEKLKKEGRGLESMGVDVVTGFSYNVTRNIVVQAHYSLSLTKSWNDYEVDATGTGVTYFNSDDRVQNIRLSVGWRF